MAAESDKGFVCVGRFSSPHGVKGAIRLRTFTAKPEGIKAFKAFFAGPGQKPVGLSVVSLQKDGAVVAIEGIETPDAAKRFQGFELFVERAALEPLEGGEYYHADLIGLGVETLDGEPLGTVWAIHDFGAGDVLEIALDKPRKGVGKSLLVPLRKPVVKAIDLERDAITIDAEGWLETDDNDL